MKLLHTIKNRAQNIRNEITTIYYAYRNPETKLLPKIIIIIALGYALSPVDLIPDFIPVIGYLDDLIIIPALISLSIKLIPEKIINESREKALKQPVVLKKNYFSASLFILIWIILIFIIIKIVMKYFKNI